MAKGSGAGGGTANAGGVAGRSAGRAEPSHNERLDAINASLPDKRLYVADLVEKSGLSLAQVDAYFRANKDKFELVSVDWEGDPEVVRAQRKATLYRDGRDGPRTSHPMYYKRQ